MKALIIMLILFGVLTGVSTYLLYLEQHPRPPAPIEQPAPVTAAEKIEPVKKETVAVSSGGSVAVASSGTSSSSSSIISVNGVKIEVTEENGDVRIVRSDKKGKPVVISGTRQNNSDDLAETVSVAIVAKNSKDTDRVDRLASRLWNIASRQQGNWSEAQIVEVRTLRRELVSLLSPEDAARVKELRLRCDDWDIELGLADPLFAFTECEVKR